MRNKPTLYCDVDGVINVHRKHRLDAHESKLIYRHLPSIGSRLSRVPLRIRWSQHITEQLAALPVQFIWLTTWNHEAVQILEPLTGIKSEAVLPYNMSLKEVRTQHNKYTLLREDQKHNPRPFIWIDDVATVNYNPAHWVNGPEHLVIKPSNRFGVTLEHLRQMTEFIHKVRY